MKPNCTFSSPKTCAFWNPVHLRRTSLSQSLGPCIILLFAWIWQKNNTPCESRGPDCSLWKEKVFLEEKKKSGTSFFSPKIGHCFLFQAGRRLCARPPKRPGSARALSLALAPRPRAARGGGGGAAPRFPALRARWPARAPPAPAGARALTALSSFPVKADRAQRACVDAAPDTLGTADASHDHGCTAAPLHTLLLRGPRGAWEKPRPRPQDAILIGRSRGAELQAPPPDSRARSPRGRGGPVRALREPRLQASL